MALSLLLGTRTATGNVSEAPAAEVIHIFHVPEDYEKTVREKIIVAAYESGVDIDAALRIAMCESTMNPMAENPHSTAAGLYQFLDGTWEWIGAEGSQFDVDENIKQFIKWYQRYPDWWECK